MGDKIIDKIDDITVTDIKYIENYTSSKKASIGYWSPYYKKHPKFIYY